MSVVVRRINPVVVVEIVGRFTMGDAPRLLRKTVRELLNEGYKKIVFNLARTAYLDSSGIGELINCQALVSSQGGAVRLVHASGKVKSLLQVTKLVTVFDAFADEEQAVDSFK